MSPEEVHAGSRKHLPDHRLVSEVVPVRTNEVASLRRVEGKCGIELPISLLILDGKELETA